VPPIVGTATTTKLISSPIRRAVAALVVVAAVCGASPVAAGAAHRRAESAGLTPVVQSVLSPPRWFKGDDARFHMEYELMLTNTIPLPVAVTALQVRGAGGRDIESLSGAQLEEAMTLLGSDAPTTALPASTSGIVWVDLSFATRRGIPKRIKHRLTIDIGPGLPAGPIITDTGGRADVARRGPVAITPPLRGGRWVAVVGPHRRALQAVNGHLRNAQRFAIDFSAKLDAEDRTHVGSASENSSYFNYGRPVIAVGAGKVVQAVDRYPDQIPNDKAPVPLEEADGNHVIVKLGKRVFAGYAHLKPGSVRVHRGDRVRSGQVLGKLGNSGNTEGPHLHFEVMNRASIVDADGLPFTLDRFGLDGRVPSLEGFLDTDLAGTPVPIDRSVAGGFRNRGLTNLDVATFPGG
jgi:Peptidase family M23